MPNSILQADITRLATILEAASDAIAALQQSVQENAVRQEGITTKLQNIETTANSLQQTVSGNDQSLLSRVAVIEARQRELTNQFAEMKTQIQTIIDKKDTDERQNKSNGIAVLALVMSTVIGVGSLFVALSTSNCGVYPAKTPPAAKTTAK